MFVLFQRPVYAKRDSDFTITVKNKTGGSSECAVRTGRVFGTNITLPCQTPLIGNVVEFSRIGGYDQPTSTLCEVVIIGHKYIGIEQLNNFNKYNNLHIFHFFL